MKQRYLELTIRMRDDGFFELDVYEPESGEVKQIEAPFSPDEHPEFDQAIGDEIYSWLRMWTKEKEEKE